MMQSVEPATQLSAPSLGAADLSGVNRCEEDYLDWLENHQHARALPPARFRHALIGLAVMLTAATMAAMAMVGF
jgi:hypothetical protein